MTVWARMDPAVSRLPKYAQVGIYNEGSVGDTLRCFLFREAAVKRRDVPGDAKIEGADAQSVSSNPFAYTICCYFLLKLLEYTRIRW